MNKKRSVSSAFFGFITRNLLLKILSVLFAIILWSNVITNSNPVREKTLNKVPIVYDRLDSLTQKDLVLRESIEELLQSVKIKVEVEYASYDRVQNETVTAKIDFSNINQEGVQTLKINASTNTRGSITSVSPATIDVTVERLSKLEVPIEVTYMQDVSKNFWHDKPILTPGSLIISGPESIVSRIHHANVQLDLGGITDDYTGAESYRLMDAKGHEVPNSSNLTIKDETVMVEIPIFPCKELPFTDLKNAVLGVPAPGYRIENITVSPETVTVAGEQFVLDELSHMDLLPIRIQDQNATITLATPINPHADLAWTSFSEVQITVTIVEDIITKHLTLPVSTKGLANTLTATIMPAQVEVDITGPRALVEKINPEDLMLYVQLKGLASGVHMLTISKQLPAEITLTPLVNQVQVTLIPLE